MKAPKCRVCEHEHWLSEPHVFPGIQKPLVVNEVVVVNALVVNALVVNGRAKDRHRKSPERAAYMRTTMRARRAGKASSERKRRGRA